MDETLQYLHGCEWVFIMRVALYSMSPPLPGHPKTDFSG